MVVSQKNKKKNVPMDIPIVWVNVLETYEAAQDPFL